MSNSKTLDSLIKSYKSKIMSSSGPISMQQIAERIIEQGEDIRLIDLSVVKKNYREFVRHFPFATVYVALKAVTQTNIFSTLVEDNAFFEIATLGELELCCEYGVSEERLLCSHPTKDKFDIEHLMQSIRLFTSDNIVDLELISEYAPGSSVLIRILTNDGHKQDLKMRDNQGFDQRFGTTSENAKSLIRHSKDIGLNPIGISFHVGIQQEDSTAWDYPINKAAQIFTDLKAEGIELKILNIGGGFPSEYKSVPPIREYGEHINKTLKSAFGERVPEIFIEPGRSISAMAGATLGRIINIKPSPLDESNLIITLSIGRYSAGLMGIGMGIYFYRVNKTNDGLEKLRSDNLINASLYGKVLSGSDRPTAHIGDGVSVMVPQGIKVDDIVVFTGTGAYTGELSTHLCSTLVPTTIVFDEI